MAFVLSESSDPSLSIRGFIWVISSNVTMLVLCRQHASVSLGDQWFVQCSPLQLPHCRAQAAGSTECWVQGTVGKIENLALEATVLVCGKPLSDDVPLWCVRCLSKLEWTMCPPIKGLSKHTYYTACKRLLYFVHIMGMLLRYDYVWIILWAVVTVSRFWLLQ